MYAMIGVELRMQGEISSNREDGSVKTHLHTSPIVVKITNLQLRGIISSFVR